MQRHKKRKHRQNERKWGIKHYTHFGQKRQDFQTLSCCGLARMLSPSALPCWRITPASFQQNHRAPGIKGARPKRPAVRVLERYQVYRPRTVGKGTVESSVCQKSWEKSSSWPQRPHCWVTGSTYIYINRCVFLWMCITLLWMIYSNIWLKVGQ